MAVMKKAKRTVIMHMQKTLKYCWWEYKTMPLWKIYEDFFQKVEIALPRDPAIPLLIIHPKDRKKLSHPRDTCSVLFTVALFITPKTMSQRASPAETYK